MPKILADDVNKKLCEGCADCCKYVAIEIDEPESARDHEKILQYLMHENVRIFVDEDDDDEEEVTWYIEFHGDCEALREDLLCGTYTTRPNICREYSPRDCPRNNPDGDGEQYQFWTPEDYLGYLRITCFEGKVKMPKEVSDTIRIAIDKPTENEDHDYIAWYLLHKGVSVFKDDRGDWYLQFVAKPRAASYLQLFGSVLVDTDATSELGTPAEEVTKALDFSSRKEYLDHLSSIGASYKLKQPKGVTEKPPELKAAIPIVSM